MIKQKSVSLADQVFDRLEEDILKGDIEYGSVITEVKVSEMLGVSRTPVREALRRLEQEHMIEETGKGMLVLGITDDDVKCIYDIRPHIEGIAARYAAEKASPELLQAMLDALELQEFYVQKGDTEKVRVMDNEFHEALYKASGSTILYDTLTALHRKVQKYRKKSFGIPGRAAEAVNEHRAVYNAIVSGDPDLAEQMAATHVRLAGKVIFANQNK